jgi:hypothetical protein
MSSRIARLLGVFPSMPEANGYECVARPHAPDYAIGKDLIRNVRLCLKSDEDLVADLLASEADALTVLFERHGALVFRIARRILRNDAEAEDAVQQVFFVTRASGGGRRMFLTSPLIEQASALRTRDECYGDVTTVTTRIEALLPS